MNVIIGVHIETGPARMRATLAHLAAHTPHPHTVLLLGDGPDGETMAALGELPAVAQSSTASALGAAACFNRLVRAGPADVYIFLESGTRVTEGWLETILSAFEAHPMCGLCGPSTNSAWNQQSAFPGHKDSGAALARTASEARREGGNSCRSLGPLHSLADFCYAVRRPVIDAIGEADEGFGLGPCWEMDYNIRAARAGFDALWVCGAYVHRAPFTPARRQRERALIDASKRRYQDKYCGLRLTGVKPDYRDHCRGDACANFAPTALISIRLTAAPGATPPAAGPGEYPLVSCIMPTYNRGAFLPASLQCFAAQDYPHLELIVVDDGPSIEALLPPDPRIHYYRSPGRLTIGAKRNFACERAHGRFIVHWDDDDWYGPDRIRRQVAPLHLNQAQISGSSVVYFLKEDGNQGFRYEYGGPVSGAWMGGLAYTRELWEKRRFDAIQIGEDVRFLAGVPPAARCDLRDPALYIGVIHSANASPKTTKSPWWTPESAAKIRAIMGRQSTAPPAGQENPLVSCIMPTWNRRPFIPLALANFRAQTYPSKELIVVDDGQDGDGGIRDLVEGQPGVRCVRLARRMAIGAKRNAACEAARGEFIAHWDDDDWYSPSRLAAQMAPLLTGLADITGMRNSYLLETSAAQFWSVSEDLHRRMFVGDVHGGTVVYRKEIWQKLMKYPAVNLAEDAALIKRAIQCGRRLLRIENNGEFVYVRHGGNAWRFQSGQFLAPGGWQRVSAPPEFSASLLADYLAASHAMRPSAPPVTRRPPQYARI